MIAAKTHTTKAEPLACYRCGASLAALTLPLARLDECPQCRVHLHVCRMCTHYAPRLTDACDEDDAIEVRDKQSANFCDYFRPNPGAYTTKDNEAETAARAQLSALFDGASSDDSSGERTGAVEVAEADSLSADEQALRDAEKLFGK
jgi:hypothetical protein